MIVISRLDAQRNHLVRYFTGRPCNRLHVAERYVTSGHCVVCAGVFLKTPEAKKQRRDAQRARRKANPDKARAVSWKSNGIPTPTRPKPLCCENCGKSPKRTLVPDHDHSTGRFRGWLCMKCNVCLGGLGDSVAGIERVLAYLKRAQS